MFSQIQARTEQVMLAIMRTSWFDGQSSLRDLQSEFLRLCCLIVLVINFLLLFAGSWISYQFYGVVTLISLSVLLLNKRGNYGIARWIFMACVHVTVFFLSAYRADLLLTYCIMLAGILLSYVLFFNEELWQLVGNILVMLFIFSVFQVTSYTLPMQVEVTDDLLNRAFIINIVCILISVVLSLLYLVIVYEKSESYLRHTLAELQVRNQEMDHYVYRVSHDLRAPLCSVTGLVNLALEEQEPETLKSYLIMIGSTIHKSDSFIQSVLTHSKVLNTQNQAAAIELEQLIRNSFQDLHYLNEWNQVQLQITTGSQTTFYSDLFRLSIVLNNIIANAIKFSNPEVAASFVTFLIEVDQKQAIIKITDNGIGIARESVDKIFDMFYRGTERSKGSGLGLYIVKQALDKIEGQIHVESKLGLGTTLTLTLKNYVPASEMVVG